MAVSKVVDAYTFHACQLRTALHLVGKIGLTDREQALARLNAIELDMLGHFFAKERRRGDGAVRLGRFRRRDNVFALKPLIALGDTEQVLV